MLWLYLRHTLSMNSLIYTHLDPLLHVHGHVHRLVVLLAGGVAVGKRCSRACARALDLTIHDDHELVYNLALRQDGHLQDGGQCSAVHGSNLDCLSV